MHVLEAGMPHVGFETLFYKEKLQVLSCHHAGGEVYGKTVSQPLLPSAMWFSSHLPRVSFSLNQPLGFYKKTVPHVAIDSVCPGEDVSSGSLYITILSFV